MGAGVGFAEQAAVLQVLHVAVVAGNAFQHAVAQAVQATVAGPQAHPAQAARGEHHHGAAHHGHATVGGFFAHGRVDAQQVIAQRRRVFVQGAAQRHMAQAVDDQAADIVPRRVPAHAIGHHPQAVFRQVQKGIFVDLANHAHMAFARGFVRHAHLHHTFLSEQKLRKIAGGRQALAP